MTGYFIYHDDVMRYHELLRGCEGDEHFADVVAQTHDGKWVLFKGEMSRMNQGRGAISNEEAAMILFEAQL